MIDLIGFGDPRAGQAKDGSLDARRTEERISAELPVALRAGGEGVTRDISASGVFFSTSTAVTEGETIEFAVEFEDGVGKRQWLMQCSAKVVRIERGTSSLGVAARIVDSKFQIRQK